MLSRSRSSRKHGIGADDAGVLGPTPQQMARVDASAIRVQALTMDVVDQMTAIHNEGFGSKVCCLCCPVGDNDGRTRKFYEKHPERLAVCGVALDRDGATLGYVQLAIHPMHDKDGLHNTQPGEAYIEQISVGAAARGRGVGCTLLQWAESQARGRGCHTLTLSVLNGNPARRLYERFGFQAKSQDGCEECLTCCIVFCIVGRPYGLCDPHGGAVDMTKALA